MNPTHQFIVIECCELCYFSILHTEHTNQRKNNLPKLTTNRNNIDYLEWLVSDYITRNVRMYRAVKVRTTPCELSVSDENCT